MGVFEKELKSKFCFIRCVIPLAFIVKRLHLVIENYTKQQEQHHLHNVNREKMCLMSYVFLELAQGNTMTMINYILFTIRWCWWWYVKINRIKNIFLLQVYDILSLPTLLLYKLFNVICLSPEFFQFINFWFRKSSNDDTKKSWFDTRICEGSSIICDTHFIWILPVLMNSKRVLSMRKRISKLRYDKSKPYASIVFSCTGCRRSVGAYIIIK